MKIQDFIINWINEVGSKFEGINIKYAIDKFTNFHIIEISPDSIESSEEFSEEALHFEFIFFDKFPNEDLLICEKSAENDMSNVIFKYENFVHHTSLVESSALSSIVLKVLPYSYSQGKSLEKLDYDYILKYMEYQWAKIEEEVIEEVHNCQNLNYQYAA